MNNAVAHLVDYAIIKKWIDERDRIWATNRIIHALGIDSIEITKEETNPLPPLWNTLNSLCDIAYEKGVIEGNSVTYYDLFDTELMGLITPRPSWVFREFNERYSVSPKEATEWYYAFSQDTNYIRRNRIVKDKKWVVATKYGDLDITINLSKPEKDPKAIAAAGRVKSSGYPKCLLCAENEGYAGHLNHPARQNHRIIPICLHGRGFFLQYSPYVYYNEHCIVFNSHHTPMSIGKEAFENLLEFITIFPHYFAGSNADLPIVGGSVLSHDHYQGGNYEFAMAKADVEKTFTIPGFEDIEAGIVNWPMSVIRIKSNDKERLVKAATHIHECWKAYDDEKAFIYHETDGEAHSTITPIARRRGEAYELDLVLRNNITTEEHPLGVFHPHSEKHHIKKENIGLIEVMGLAILPARLLDELAAVEEAIINKTDMSQDSRTAAHKDWALQVMANHPELNKDNVHSILEEEVGKVFCEVLEDAGVFKRDEEGREAFDRFISIL